MKDRDGSLPEIPSSRGDDIHNIQYMDSADLVLFMAGNQFMVMDDLLSRFRQIYPDVKRIFYETLPPGLELRQILAGGAVFQDKVIDTVPDIYTSVTEEAMKELSVKGRVNEYFIYLHNRLALMVSEGNPCNIKSVKDLGRDDIRISQPGRLEDIAHYITAMYRKAGGDELVRKILEQKKADGTTVFTTVHHRETPQRITRGLADVGPVWATEVVNAQKDGLRVEAVEPGEEFDQRDSVNYFIARLADAPNPGNAEKFLDFIKSPEAQEIYRQHGFVPHFA
ncbi:MAG: ABC transporter substrate-binding protein [Deferribacteres bacterium]|nr:ABC transporter substrate-binding protein [Deferribacteres bacterium]